MRILFAMVSAVKFETEQISLLLESAKKYFLTNHDIEYVIFTDSLFINSFNGAKVIRIDNTFCKTLSCYQFQKVLSLQKINLEDYDYVFVHDIDQVYINYVNDDDLLTNDLYIPHHLCNQNTKALIEMWSNVVRIDKDIEHTSGNIFGGPRHIIKLFVEYSIDFYNKYKNNILNKVGFFSEHPEEVMLIKFIDYYRIKEKRITCSLDFDKPAFFTDIRINGNISDNQLKNFKLIHATKVNITWCRMLFDKSKKID